MNPVREQRPAPESLVPRSTEDPGIRGIHAITEAIGELRSRPRRGPLSDLAQPGPTRAEIEEWIREDLRRTEEKVREGAEATRDELTAELRELVETRVSERVTEIEAAAQWLEQQTAEFQARASHARIETEERIAGALQSLSFRARRHELKLARQERNRRIKSAERRLGARADVLMAELERHVTELEERIRYAELAAERRLVESAESIVATTRRRLRDALESEAGVAGEELPVGGSGAGAPVRRSRFSRPSSV